MISISTNTKSIIIRLLLVVLITATIFLMWNYEANRSLNDAWLLYLAIAGFAYCVLGIIISCCGIIRLQLDRKLSKMVLFRFFSRQNVAITDIAGYYVSVYSSKRGISYGRIITLRDGKIFELHPLNLKNPAKIDEFLKEYNLDYLGEKRTSYPFARGL